MGSSQLNGWPHILKLGLYHFVYKRNWVWAGDFRRDTEFENCIQFLFSHFWGFLWTMIIKLKDWYQTPKSNFDTHGIAQLLAPKFWISRKSIFLKNHVPPFVGRKMAKNFISPNSKKMTQKCFFGFFSNYWVAFWGNPVFNFDFLALFKKWAKSR